MAGYDAVPTSPEPKPKQSTFPMPEGKEKKLVARNQRQHEEDAEFFKGYKSLVKVRPSLGRDERFHCCCVSAMSSCRRRVLGSGG